METNMSTSVGEKVDRVTNEVAYIRGQLDKILPNLATKQDLQTALLKHQIDCTPKQRGKVARVALPAGLITAIATAIAALATAWQG